MSDITTAVSGVLWHATPYAEHDGRLRQALDDLETERHVIPQMATHHRIAAADNERLRGLLRECYDMAYACDTYSGMAAGYTELVERIQTALDERE